MKHDPEMFEKAQKVLREIERVYGFVPVTNQVLSERPDFFLPSSSLAGSIFEGESSFDRKTRHLIALAASAALGAEHCMRAQIADAVNAGATEDEVLEVLETAAYMCMTRSQSYSFREFAHQFGKDIKEM